MKAAEATKENVDQPDHQSSNEKKLEPILESISTTPEVPQNPEPTEPQTVNENLIKISESTLYKKYFLMLKFGVSATAVKLKMKSEGFECHLLDNPDLLVEKPPEEDDEE